MKILFVHFDYKPWATSRRAEYLKKELTDDQVDIVEGRTNLPQNADKYDLIHILFSSGMTKIKNFILDCQDKVFTTLASHRTLDCAYDHLDDLIEIYQKTLCCVAQNPWLAKRLRLMIGQDNVVYIPNGVDTELFNRKFTAGFVGSMHSFRKGDHKGLNIARKACSQLGIEIKVLCVDSYRNAISLTEMPKFYQQIDCLIIPSKSEGCNNPTLEALAMNVPVISTDVGIASKLDGVILADRSVEGVKTALRKLSGRIQILENYTWKIIAKKYRNLYEKVLNQK